MFQFEGTYLSSISGSGDLAVLKIFLLHLVFNLICIHYANDNVTIDRIITKKNDQARIFLFYNLAAFILFFPFIFQYVFARAWKTDESSCECLPFSAETFTGS